MPYESNATIDMPLWWQTVPEIVFDTYSLQHGDAARTCIWVLYAACMTIFIVSQNVIPSLQDFA